MAILGDAARWMLIGGSTYPAKVESVMSGAMQARYAHSSTRREKDVLVHPDYMFANVAQTTHAIRGAFTLRLIGLNGMPLEDLRDYEVSTEKVPQLELLGNEPMTYRLLGVRGAMSFLKITRLAQIKDGLVQVREKGAELLEAHPVQPYTVYPEELRQLVGTDIGGEYTYRPLGQTTTQTAAVVLQQYAPGYDYS